MTTTPVDSDEALTADIGSEMSLLRNAWALREIFLADIDGKDITLIDSNLYSGSNDAFRSTMG